MPLRTTYALGSSPLIPLTIPFVDDAKLVHLFVKSKKIKDFNWSICRQSSSLCEVINRTTKRKNRTILSADAERQGITKAQVVERLILTN